MPHLVVAGFSAPQIRTLVQKGAVNVRAAWTLRFVDNLQKQGLAGFRARPVLEEAAKNPSSHVLGVSQQDGERRQKISGEIKAFFRFRWLEGAALNTLLRSNFTGFVDLMQPILEEEERWAEEIKPSRSSDALLLPRPSFACKRQLDIWEYAEAYNDPQAVANASSALKRFKAKYFLTIPPSGRYASTINWTDENDLVFDHRGERHGDAPFPRTWKYSFGLEDRFHFDVRHRTGYPCELTGANGTRPVVRDGYVNIDSHGYFR